MVLNSSIISNAAFTHNGFNEQERNLTVLKTDFQVLKLKFHVCSFKQAFYPFHNLNITRARQHKNTLTQVFLSVPGCQTVLHV